MRIAIAPAPIAYGLIGLLAFGLPVAQAAPEPTAPAASQSAAPAPEETRAQELIAAGIDAARTARAPNAQPLRSDPVLTRIARERALTLASGAPFGHEDLLGNRPAIDMVQASFGRYGFIGENIFMQARGGRGFEAGAFAKLAVKQWMTSQEHRDNILDPDYDASGIGVVVSGNETYAVQVFRGSAPPGKASAGPKKKPGARLRGGWQLDGF